MGEYPRYKSILYKRGILGKVVDLFIRGIRIRTETKKLIIIISSY